MEQKCERLCSSEPVETVDLEQRLEKKLNDVNSFNNHINNIKEMITYFKGKNNKSKKKYKKDKTITRILKSFDTFKIIGHNIEFYYVMSYRNRFGGYTNINCNSMRLINW